MANHLSFDALSRLVESRGSTNAEPRVRRHLASCARCRSELEWLQRIQGVPGPGGGFEVGRREDFEPTARLCF